MLKPRMAGALGYFYYSGLRGLFCHPEVVGLEWVEWFGGLTGFSVEIFWAVLVEGNDSVASSLRQAQGRLFELRSKPLGVARGRAEAASRLLCLARLKACPSTSKRRALPSQNLKDAVCDLIGNLQSLPFNTVHLNFDPAVM